MYSQSHPLSALSARRPPASPLRAMGMLKMCEEVVELPTIIVGGVSFLYDEMAEVHGVEHALFTLDAEATWQLSVRKGASLTLVEDYGDGWLAMTLADDEDSASATVELCRPYNTRTRLHFIRHSCAVAPPVFGT